MNRPYGFGGDLSQHTDKSQFESIPSIWLSSRPKINGPTKETLTANGLCPRQILGAPPPAREPPCSHPPHGVPRKPFPKRFLRSFFLKKATLAPAGALLARRRPPANSTFPKKGGARRGLPRRAPPVYRAMPQLLSLAELLFADTAKGANEILGKVFKLRACRDTVLRIALCLIIFPTTNVTYIFFHNDNFLSVRLLSFLCSYYIPFSFVFP